MSQNPENIAAGQIVKSVRAAFPDEAVLIDAMLFRDGYDEDACFTWLEHFSQFTTDAMGRRDFPKAMEHLDLLSQLLARGDERTKKCIDVAYVESLMWDVRDQKLKSEGWKLIPSNLKALYVAMWGEQPFMKGKA
jgi:hypothetical protein